MGFIKAVCVVVNIANFKQNLWFAKDLSTLWSRFVLKILVHKEAVRVRHCF